MAEHGYSGTPLPKKLGIRDGAAVVVVHAPEDVIALIAPLPQGVRISRRVSADADVCVAFFTRRAALEREFDRLRRGIHDAGGLWIAWPKRASGVATDVTEDVVREIALAAGLVDNKVCAIDATWSALRVVVRRENRRPATPRR